MKMIGYDNNEITIEFDLDNKDEKKIFLYLYLLDNKERVNFLKKCFRIRKELKKDRMLYNTLLKVIEVLKSNRVIEKVDRYVVEEKKDSIKKEIKQNNVVKENKSIINNKEVKNEKGLNDIDSILDSFIDSGF